MLQVIFLFAMFASIFGLTKATLQYSEPYFIIGSRMAFAGLILLGYQLLTKASQFKMKKQEFILICALGFINIYLTNIFEILGLKTITSAKACLIYSISPFLAALFSFFIFSEVLTKKKWLGMTLGFIGLFLLMLEGALNNPSGGSLLSQFGHFERGDIYLTVAVCFSVYGWILLKKILCTYNKTPLFVNGLSMFLGGSFALVHSFIAGESWNPLPISDPSPFVRNTLLICLISNVICYNLYGYLLKKYSATYLSFAGLVSPLFASLFGWLFLDETVSYVFAIAFLFFMFGLMIFHREESSELVPA